mmetsp:Transcript_19561/g.30630  ORF Transcript_19561/g.30630 Transcript_19561/m.30630 type:complete len:195 (+) Transcript_19561:135-719(+)|eukprot:CAMPEP_0184315236 /NCGR_PEP_ID=MMETSP1049-20130417/80897_1 /TAXON_ID=77928 /ORGANISM="Proteomonas sulcata, Strain CCMP704" /LENGTH=194 /DNA_ID=CAMNT_0026633597 /DNA_START=125 /DNA_END=709 /DNA_ORIENTATION=-
MRTLLLLCSILGSWSFILSPSAQHGLTGLQISSCGAKGRGSLASKALRIGSVQSMGIVGPRPTVAGGLRVRNLGLRMVSETEEEVFEGDVVEYEADETCTVGWVEGFEGESIRLLPLVRREGMGEECYIDESQPSLLVPRENCRYINVYPQQRVAWSMDSPHHNPHGEESEDCFVIEDDLSDKCVILVKHISET